MRNEASTPAPSQPAPSVDSTPVSTESAPTGKSPLKLGVKRTEEPDSTPDAPAPDAPTPTGVDYNRWLGPAPKREFNPNRFHGNWQWYRDYGNDGVHDIDMACFGLCVDRLPIRVTAHGTRNALTG